MLALEQERRIKVHAVLTSAAWRPQVLHASGVANKWKEWHPLAWALRSAMTWRDLLARSCLLWFLARGPWQALSSACRTLELLSKGLVHRTHVQMDGALCVRTKACPFSLCPPTRT